MYSKTQKLFRPWLLEEIFSYIYFFFFLKEEDINPIYITIRILTSMNIRCKKGFSFTPMIKENFLQSVVNIWHMFSRWFSLLSFPIFYTDT